ncbi:NUDIX hydrolase [Hwanghaeella sp.]|uniref:NUDIX hydrolase n=1 Tax=Hwanghaeella sp. TaxID=2605943 RepID=UPI003CCB94CC
MIDLLRNHVPADATEEDHRENTLGFVSRTANCASRETLEGHVTASAWILSPDLNAVLLTHHKKLGRWLQLGGHVENDVSIQAAALREAREESGISKMDLLDETLFDIDVHLIPERKGTPAHYHYDFRFLIQAGDRDFTVGTESNDLAWLDVTKPLESLADDSIVRMQVKTETALKRAGKLS